MQRRRFTLLPLRRVATVVLVTLACLFAAPDARAQGTQGLVPDPITSRDLRVYADRLDLASDQRLALSELHQQYLERFSELRESEIQELLDRLSQFKPMQLPGEKEVKTMLDLRRRAMALIEETDRRFFEDVRGLLTPTQQEQLPRVVRARAKERYEVDFGPGGSMDLVELIEGLEFTDQETDAIDDAVVQYEIASLAAVRELHDVTLEMFLSILKELEKRGFSEQSLQDPTAAAGMFQALQEAYREASKDQVKATKNLASLTTRSLRQIADLLPPESADRLMDAYNQKAYPQVYPDRDSAQRLLNAALALDDITLDEQSALLDLAQRHREQHDRLCKKMVEVLDEQNARPLDFDQRSRRKHREQLRDLRTQREKLNRTTADSVADLLDVDRFALAQRAANRLAGDVAVDDEQSPAPEVIPDEFESLEQPARSVYARPITRRDMEVYGRALRLDADQRAALRSMHEDYLHQFQELRDGRIQTLVDEPRRKVYSEAGRIDLEAVEAVQRGRAEARALIEELDAKFLDDVAMLLTEEQHAALSQVRLRRRRAMFDLAFDQAYFVSQDDPSRIDLVQVVEGLSLEDAQAEVADPILTQYVERIVPLLDDFYELVLEQNSAWLKIYARYSPEEMEETQTMMEAGMEAQQVIRDIGKRTALLRAEAAEITDDTLTRLEQALPPQQADRLLAAYYETAYPDVYPDHDASDPVFDEAMGLRDLTTPQYEELQAAFDHYAAEHDRLCSEMIDIVSKYNRSGQSPYDPDSMQEQQRYRTQLERLEFERSELNALVRTRIGAVLTPEQVKRMRSLRHDDE
ncbi:MAG: hypothetical protein KAS72_05430 [Phycisphaerales bacterium]|nr:hypothetical protein [Phycisphaerales bacterium]